MPVAAAGCAHDSVSRAAAPLLHLAL